jgi:copper oxidase (laccase) domain-containing protein
MEFMDRFAAHDPGYGAFLQTGRRGRINACSICRALCCGAWSRPGVRHADWIGHDTFEEEDLFFSNRRAFHRSEADYGRLMSVISLV